MVQVILREDADEQKVNLTEPWLKAQRVLRRRPNSAFQVLRLGIPLSISAFKCVLSHTALAHCDAGKPQEEWRRFDVRPAVAPPSLRL